MTYDDTLKIMSVLKASYPAYYRDISRSDSLGIVGLWQEMFADEPYEVVAVAVKDLLATDKKGFPPHIGAVKTKIAEIVAAVKNEPTDEELWQIFKKALSNAYYGAKEEFEKLPPILQTYAGSPSTLRDLSQIDCGTLDTVYHGQFLRQFPSLKQRTEYQARLPDAVKLLVLRDISQPRALTAGEWNAKRNELMEKLEDEN